MYLKKLRNEIKESLFNELEWIYKNDRFNFNRIHEIVFILKRM